LESMMDFLEKGYPELAEWFERNPTERKPDLAHSSKKYVLKTEVNASPRNTEIDTDFLSGREYLDLIGLKESLKQLGSAPYVLEVDDKKVTAQTWQQLLKLALDDAQSGLAIQRYKGLGEMNPEQLQETTMDRTRRTLMQVKVSDAVEAETIFSTLMGDEVEPRRLFIERNALNATLDV
jgi:DNA gyrase subunit B